VIEMSDCNVLGIDLTNDEYSTVNTAVVYHYGETWNEYTAAEKQEIIHNIIGR
jgi:hypothetical protein